MSVSAHEHGDRPAVVDEDVSVTYAELDVRVQHAAESLVAAGVRPGTRVGVYLPRCLDATIAIYGALRAGAVVAPLDVTDPVRRTERVLAVGGIEFLLVNAGTEAKAHELAEVERPRTAPVDGGIGCVDLGRPFEGSRADGGYILFTSGSTGWPKGVLLSHGNVLHFAYWAATELGLRPTDRIGAQSALTFDLSTFDLFATAVAGACAELMPEHYRTFPMDVLNWLHKRGVSVFYAVPTLYRLLLQNASIDRNPPALRVIAFAGEPLQPQVLRGYLSAFPDSAFYNLYGPTETNVCTFERISAGWTPVDPVSIGRPIDGVCVTLVDGEIHVSGPTVLQGYLDNGVLRDPTRTVRRPDGEECRAYPTGDLAVPTEDGRLLLTGRRDDQVKRAGHRIELRDVESALLELPAVRGGAVVAKQDGQIWAYVVSTGQDGRAIADALADLLPRRMLPDRVVLCPDLPTTAHGKVDRRRLVEPDPGDTCEHR